MHNYSITTQLIWVAEHDIYVKVSKQELYFAKENYEIFSTEVSAREKTRTEQGWATSRSYWVSCHFIRRSAFLNLFAG